MIYKCGVYLDGWDWWGFYFIWSCCLNIGIMGSKYLYVKFRRNVNIDSLLGINSKVNRVIFLFIFMLS